jgi:hypothetical protein
MAKKNNDYYDAYNCYWKKGKAYRSSKLSRAKTKKIKKVSGKRY